ncbi:MAG: ATP-binding cassette domain-containing protein [Tannerellaceae bacterium]|nr:ATP-binding cassette domain-containing protein [Tannerellaceae bacterium]
MNESILSGLLNLFALFASLVKIENEQAQRTILSYLSSHFGVRSHKEYIELYNELRSMYDDPSFPIDKEIVIRNVCNQMKIKLTAEEQLLLLVRFIEFAHTNSDGLDKHLNLFCLVADIFSIPEDEFQDALSFVEGRETASIVTISGVGGKTDNHITRKNMEGVIAVLYIRRFDKYIFTYHGEGLVYMNNIPLAPDMFYAWQPSSVIKGRLFHPIYYSNIQAVYNKKEHKEIVYLAGRDIQFRYKNSQKNGLHNFSFNLTSGQLVAIMGGSGVGKSTLLGIMNGNILPDSGIITVNGHPLQLPEVKQLIGFVPQDDLLIEELTVYQNLWFTARLCFDRLSEAELEERVNNVLKELDLTEIKDLAVGSPVRKTISGGQRKRLNIALELIREPAILYLDEPTSGLSSADSEKVITLLKEQTHCGRLVVVNIHQPSSEIYKLFDKLWLLDKGGYPIYDGNPIEAITYFKQAAKFTDQDISVCNACGNVTPELILNIIDSMKIDDSGNLTSIRKFTPEEWHEMYLESRHKYYPPKEAPLPENRQKRPSRWKQFLIFFERTLVRKFTNKQYMLIALLEAPLLAFIVALLTRYMDGEEYTLLGNKNFVSYIFMSVIVVTFIGMSISADELIKDRLVLKRERFLRLSQGSYLTSNMIYLLLVSGIQSFLFIAVGNTIMGVGKDMFFIWWSVLWISAFLANLVGLLLSQNLNSIVAIYISIPLLLIPQILLCGLVIHFDDLNTSAAKKNIVPLIGEVIPSRWAFEALVVEQFVHNDYNKRFFPVEREKYLAQYYRTIHLPEVRRQVDLWETEQNEQAKRTVENELKVMGKIARLESNPSESYRSYLDRLDIALRDRSHNFTAYQEQLMRELIKEKGHDRINAEKRSRHNMAIEELVLSSNSNRFFRTYQERIYPKIAPVYFEPDNTWGRAQFYSHVKKVGNYKISTYIFNLLVLGFFVVLSIIAIFAEFPARFIKEKNEY